ncbi:hypothetical protein GCM10009839_10190 [Catenulispora yoronensis]|uniref:Transposase IS4-like domain-containing protein n=1 Tax=Catenulispora yoronensis TaxID=450799 RepID=A0ABN2TPF4_9ACTN
MAGGASQATAGADVQDASPGEDRAATRRRRKARAAAAGLGRSRGGLSSKVDAAGMPLAFVLTPGQAADCRRLIPVLDKIRVPGPVGRPRTRPGAVAADKAYSSKANRSYLR